MATLINNENAAPQDNIIQTVVAPIKPVQEQTQEITTEPVQETVESVEEPVEEQIESDSEDDEVDSEEEYEEFEDEDPIDAAYGEQSEEAGGPLSLEEEAAAAKQLAEAFGFNSTDDALGAVGKKTEDRLNSTLNTYSDLLKQDTEVVQFYDTISEKINTLRASLNTGLSKMLTEISANQTVDAAAIDILRNQLETFLRTVLNNSEVMNEYLGRSQTTVQDLLQSLQRLGRPLYWHSTKSSELAAETMEEDDENDDDYTPEKDEEEEEEEMNWEAQNGNEEDEPSTYYIDSAAWKEIVQVVRQTESQDSDIQEEGYEVLQAACENYIGSILEATMKSCKYLGKPYPTGNEVKFALEMMSAVRV